ncbi:hypothetical protein GH714_020694 [Hevea brasiliensis]|uniref:Uncharacterized protein n=1 Tax=Hevea brasiliensis TaxID=3981 RepID=A0A6A6LIE3_HEVBR|nr:hypothetical protein GH714_020694 [Hevea brasiliensis]
MDLTVIEAIAQDEIETFEELVKADKAILEQRTTDSLDTVLHLASIHGHLEMAKKITEWRSDLVAAENKQGETPFHEACRRGDLKMLTLLLGVNTEASYKANAKNQSPLFLACRNGHLELVKLLLERPEIDNAEIFEALVDKMPNLVEKLDEDGNSTVHSACMQGDSYVIAEYLIKEKITDVNALNNKELTPLDVLDQAGIYGGEKEALETLLIVAGGKRKAEMLNGTAGESDDD